MEMRNQRGDEGRPYASGRLFVTDLDGTLLDSNKQITGPTRQTLKAWTAQGGQIAIATGRALTSALAMRKAVGLEELSRCIIACNGAQIYDAVKGEMLFERTIPKKTVEEILDLAEELEIHCHTYHGPYIVARRETEALRAYRFHIHMPVIVHQHISEALPQDPCLMLGIEIVEPDKLKRFKKLLERDFSDTVKPLFSSDHYLDILPAGTDKGEALSRLCGLLGIPLSDTVAAGDEENDLSMILAAGTGIGMKNGTNDVKKAADIVTTEDNDHDGLSEALRSLMEIQ